MLKETYLGTLVKFDITIKIITLTFRKYMSGDKSI